MTGPLEPTNSAYAVAKIAGIEMCWSYNRQYGTRFVPVMPTNLYGPNDNFDLENSHVLPALMRKFHEAKEGGKDSVTIWGTGKPRREFLHVDDMAAACVHVMSLNKATYLEHTQPMLSHINVGAGNDCTIKELAQAIAKVVGFKGRLYFDSTKPDGTPKKLLDVSRLEKMGWQAGIGLEKGLENAYEGYAASSGSARS